MKKPASRGEKIASLFIYFSKATPPGTMIGSGVLRMWAKVLPANPADSCNRSCLKCAYRSVVLICAWPSSFCTSYSDTPLFTKPLSLTGAIYKVLEEVPEIMGDGDNYDYEQIRSWWYDRDKLHMQSPIRSVNDPDNPY